MYIIVDELPMAAAGYVASFDQEGVPSLGLRSGEFQGWIRSGRDLSKVQGFLLGEFEDRIAIASLIRQHSYAPIIAVSEVRSLEQTLDLCSAKFDDVVRKPIHVREILARSEAIWRRTSDRQSAHSTNLRIKVHFDGRDPEIDGVSLPLPRRERHILEYLVRNYGRWVSKAQLFRTVYDAPCAALQESVVEGHVSKLRKRLHQRLGHDPIQTERHAGYCFLG